MISSCVPETSCIRTRFPSDILLVCFLLLPVRFADLTLDLLSHMSGSSVRSLCRRGCTKGGRLVSTCLTRVSVRGNMHILFRIFTISNDLRESVLWELAISSTGEKTPKRKLLSLDHSCFWRLTGVISRTELVATLSERAIECFTPLCVRAQVEQVSDSLIQSSLILNRLHGIPRFGSRMEEVVDRDQLSVVHNK